MALSTYTELLASVASWIHRSDLTSQIADFVTLAEAAINADVHMRLMEADESLSLTSGTRTVTLPSRYIEPISLDLVISGEPNEQLIYRQPQQICIDANSTSSRRPTTWTINGLNIEFPNLADATYTLKFRMLKGFDIASTSTNALLTAYPGMYLYGALLQSAPYLMKDDRIATWMRMYDDIVMRVRKKESRSKALNGLVSDLPGTGGNCFNVYAG